MRLVIVADTHIPARARDLPEPVWSAVKDADVVLHAGDWIGADLLHQLTERSRRLIGCYGNNDGPDLRSALPEVARATLDGLHLVVVHETGPATGRERRLATAHPDADVIVFGHSHIPWDTMTPRPGSGRPLRLLNPGSPTDRRRQPHPTFMTATIQDGALADVELHQLPIPVTARAR
ncbi:metallophosphoesterase family protein [Parafrankia sp. FMc2]|uniref:metallophosphoesterase family protein n=1 Tax=Parafrankia sp. FMc2 TaxID=3233196 RepID=UPI0034D3A5B5